MTSSVVHTALSLYLYKLHNINKICSRRHFQMIFAGALRFNTCHAEPGYLSI